MDVHSPKNVSIGIDPYSYHNPIDGYHLLFHFVSEPPWHHRGAAVDGQPHRRHAGGHQQVTPGCEAPNGLATDHLPWPWWFDGENMVISPTNGFMNGFVNGFMMVISHIWWWFDVISWGFNVINLDVKWTSELRINVWWVYTSSCQHLIMSTIETGNKGKWKPQTTARIRQCAHYSLEISWLQMDTLRTLT